MRDEAVIGIAQWLPCPGHTRENMATALGLIDELAQRGADLVVLPELWPCGYNSGSLSTDAAAAAEPLTGPRVDVLGQHARKLGIWLAAGSVPERDGRDLYNTALLFDRRGQLRAWHRKVYLFSLEGEDKVFSAGTRLTTCRTDEFGIIGLAICFDGDFPEVARALRRVGATMVILPAAYGSSFRNWWELLYPAHALTNGQWWVMANHCGANSSATLLGESQVISPLGDVTVRGVAAAKGETPPTDLLVASIPLRRAIARAEEADGVLWQLPQAGPSVHEFALEPSGAGTYIV